MKGKEQAHLNSVTFIDNPFLGGEFAVHEVNHSTRQCQ